MYYLIVMIAVVLFGGCFAVDDEYRKIRGNTPEVSLRFTMFSSLGGFIVLLIANKGVIDCTPFTFTMATLSSLNGIGFYFFAFKALGKINLSMYSLYSMLGGMLLPFFQGILFYGESFTISKLICCLFIIAALICSVDKGNMKGGYIYYSGIFVLNGMSGVLSKIFTSSSFPKTDASSFSILTAVCSIVIALVCLLIFYRNKSNVPKENFASLSLSFIGGTTNRIANLMLIVSLAHIDASAQYPLVTGGVMIASTAICFLKKNKPTNKEILSVVLAFAGMVAMFVIPV